MLAFRLKRVHGRLLAVVLLATDGTIHSVFVDPY